MRLFTGSKHTIKCIYNYALMIEKQLKIIFFVENLISNIQNEFNHQKNLLFFWSKNVNIFKLKLIWRDIETVQSKTIY